MGAIFSCALSGDGKVKCWGENSTGVLGVGDSNDRGNAPGQMGSNLPAVDLGTGRKAMAIAAGQRHVCALLDGGQLKCWGEQLDGELGLGDRNSRGSAPGEMGDNLPAIDFGAGRSVVAVAPGSTHTCARLDDGHLKCWGANSNGELGQGDTNNRGATPGTLGDNLPSIDLGTGRTATAVSSGGKHTCALLDNGQMKCWGLNHSGQLGLGDTNDRGDNAGEMGDALPAIDLGTGRSAVTISAGGAHTCAVLDNGDVKCWGDFSAGQLGLGDASYRGKLPSDMGDNLPPVALGTGQKALAVIAGAEHTCAVLDVHQLKCWGLNFGGDLGIGDMQPRGRAPADMGDNLPIVALGSGRSVFSVAVGAAHTCALLDDGEVKCWGNSGELGLGDTMDRGGAPGQMGDALPEVPVW